MTEDLPPDDQPTAASAAAQAYEHLRQPAAAPNLTLAQTQALLAEALAQQAALLHAQRPAGHTEAEEARRESEAKYRTLFESMDEGFAIEELVYDDNGQIVDIIFREVNRTYERQGGLLNVVGKSLKEVLPNMEQHWKDVFAQVAATGEPVRLINYAQDVGRWFDTYITMLAGSKKYVAVVFNDITERKLREEQQAFLLQLSEALQAVAGPVEVQQVVTHTTMLHFGADRCYYCEISDTEAVIRRDAAREGLPSVAGTYPLDRFTILKAVIEAGRPFIVPDVRTTDTVDEELRQLCLALQVVSYLNVPVVREGRTVGVLCLVQSTPRAWLADHVTLLTEVAERTWAAVERARAEEALRLSEARLRALVTNLPGAAVFVVGPDLRYQLAEGEALAAAGFVPADLLGRTVAEAMPAELVASYEARYRQALAGRSFTTEHAAHGHVYISRGMPLLDAAGQPAAVLVVSYDITARKQAEEALQASEARLAEFNHRLEQLVAERTQELRESRDQLQSMFDTSLIAMSMMQAVRDEAGHIVDFRILAVNRELERQTGRSDLVGRLYVQEYPGVVPAGIFAMLLRVVATGQPEGREYYYGHEGLNRWYASQFVKMGDGVVSTNLDVTERRQAEQELRQNLRLLEQSEEVAQSGSWVRELSPAALHWSAGMYRLFALAPGTPVQPDIYLARVVAEDRAVAEHIVRSLTTEPADFEESLRLRVGDTERCLRIKAVVLRDATGQPLRLLGVDVDISQVKRLEADNLRLRLRQQQAMFEAVLAAQEAERRRIAEALHNGVGQTLYAAKLQLDQLHAPEINTPGARAYVLLADAIRQTRAISHELVPTVLTEFGLVAAVQDICRKLRSPQLQFACHLELDGLVLPQPLQVALYRMAQELAQNIVRHARASEASLTLETVPGFVLLRAEDNGVGFPAGGIPGTGLGLPGIRDRVALLDGVIDVGSAPQVGTYVRIRIPVGAAG